MHQFVLEFILKCFIEKQFKYANLVKSNLTKNEICYYYNQFASNHEIHPIVTLHKFVMCGNLSCTRNLANGLF
jgi:hypothetical protein